MARERTERLGERSSRPEAAEHGALAGARPRTVGELLDLATEVLLSHLGRLFGLSFCVIALSAGLVTLLSTVLPTGDEASLTQLLLKGGMLGLAVQMAATAVIGVCAIKVTLQAVLGNAVATRSFWSAVPLVMLVSMMNTAFVILGGVFTLGLGSIVLAYKFLYAEVVVVTDKVSPLGALVRSWELTRSSFGRCAAVMLGGVLMLMPLQLAAVTLSTNQGYEWLLDWAPTLSPVLIDVVLVLLGALLLALPTALLGVIRAALYADTLIRREGVDLDARLAARIARRRSTEPPPAPAAPAQELI